jgi:hypothetical protein
MNFSLYTLWQKIRNQARASSAPKTLAEYNRQMLVKAGKMEFEKLKSLGLSIPVAHL